MRLIIENTKTKTIIGGKDNLLDFDIIAELRKYMRVRPKNYSRTTAYREGRWDGWQYFITPKGTFATGYLPQVYNKCISMGVHIIIEDRRKDIPQLQEDIDPYIGCINGKEVTARDYQVQIVESVRNWIKLGDLDLYFPRGILDCATNAGKTYMSALLINNLKGKHNVIFLVSGRIIYNQSVEFFSQVIGEPVGEVRAGLINTKWFTVCMVKSLLNAAKDNMNLKGWLANIDVLIVDESDEAGAKQYSKTVTMINAGMRVFVSGTPLDSDSKVNKMIQLGLSGPVLAKISKRELIDLGVSQEPDITILLNDADYGYFGNYRDEMYTVIHTSAHRVELICAEIEKKHLDKQIVITFIEKVHGYFMLEYIEKRFPNLSCAILHGELKGRDRDDIVELYKSGKIDILVSSMVIQRGANIPSIRVLFTAQGGKSKIRVKQISGRGERHDGVNDEFYYYDFYDMGKWVGDHSLKRIKTLIKEELKVKFNYEHKRYRPI